MRLTKLKLAGFKSFVDPTTVELPGQLVGVVGPNGCGKSNIMDAVRWVLGESKASELRGESMQDVIFNGSTHRNPVSRASVELVFDNALGRALGQWSQYAELAVKRVLTRNGQSDYFINNLKVRRRDITDLFLGTGLGPRAYAIIGQGMISRIIEARPDELRVFLEEAAGVTRYKERRKETQGRLEDSRENLLRVEDIRTELATQMEHLESQAEVARQYRQHNEALVRKQQVLWLTRRNEARVEHARLEAEVARAASELEAATATLRETETRLEIARENHFAAGETLHQTQSAFYAANAEVARLETEIRHRKEARRQLEARLLQLDAEERQWREQTEKLARDSERWRELAEHAERRVEEAEAKQEFQDARLPEAEAERDAAQGAVDAARREVAGVEQALQVELTHQAHARRTLETLTQRRERLRTEAAQTENVPETAVLEAKREAEAEAAARLEETGAALEAAEARLPEIEAARRAAEALVQNAARNMAAREARLATLEQLQGKANQQGNLPDWLKRHGLDAVTPLWRSLEVAAGWEAALEAVLRERLQARPAKAEVLAKAEGWENDRPGQKLCLAFADTVEARSGDISPPALADTLLARITTNPTAADLRALLAEWLAGVRVCETLAQALRRRTELADGEAFVTPAGDWVDRAHVLLFAPENTGAQGLLERQREIETLSAERAAEHAAAESAEAALADAEEARRVAQTQAQNLRQHQRTAQETLRHAQVEALKCAQALERRREQSARVEAQLRDLETEEGIERERERLAEETAGALREKMDLLREREAQARERLEAADWRLREERERAAALERELREAQFSQRECQGKLEENAAGLALAQRQLERVVADLADCRSRTEEAPPEVFEEQLQGALESRREAETALAACRDALEAAAQTLRDLEETRLRLEQGQEPLRARIGDLRLKAQAAEINAGQLATQLEEAGADEAALQEDLIGARPQALSQEIGRLQKAILDLGAVNLAALEELEAARTRKSYLDGQAADLTEAMETLEAAIRRIDRETRELLQATFDTVNGHFGRLFPELFGGGRSELVMTGEEILEAGVQVIAQPPGKKNASIHLLSGGEKALTAIALVFSMFQLNPAPFCLLDEVDAPLDDTNTERFCQMVKKMSGQTQFLFISHNKIAMEMAAQLVGVTMQESGVSRVVEVDMETALRMGE
ncbi:MAG: chromosome segregation protein SMC [Zoogloeaceae bacterium]|nr:chromosome segregation protein SMC [Zoogloeaceae bacterium]